MFFASVVTIMFDFSFLSNFAFVSPFSVDLDSVFKIAALTVPSLSFLGTQI